MTKPKDTVSTAEKQQLFGRIPANLLPKLRGLTHLDVHVFTVLSVLANFKREPLGEVCMSIAAIAREVGIPRKSLYRSLGHLEASGLVSWGHSKCVMVTHYLSHGDTPPVSSGHADQPQLPIESSTSKAPIRSEEDHKKQKAAAAKKKPRRKPRSCVYWNNEEKRLGTVKSHPAEETWWAYWVGELGSEERLEVEFTKANKWLLRHPARIARTKNFQKLMDNWLNKEVNGEEA